MCPVLHTDTDKDQNLMTGWRHFSKKRKLYYTNGGNHCFIICFRYFNVNVTLLFTLWDFSHMSLLHLSSDGLIIFCFFVHDLRVVAMASTL